MSPESVDQQHWEAFRYLAGEMSSDEIAQFEEQLAQCQATREALAEAVELTFATRCALVEGELRVDLAPQAAPQRRTTPIQWIAIGTALSLLIISTWLGINAFRSTHPGNDGGLQVAIRVDNPAELASMWVETRDSFEVNSVSGMELELLETDDPLFAETAELDEVTPSWLMIAVADLVKGMKQEESVE